MHLSAALSSWAHYDGSDLWVCNKYRISAVSWWLQCVSREPSTGTYWQNWLRESFPFLIPSPPPSPPSPPPPPRRRRCCCCVRSHLELVVVALAGGALDSPAVGGAAGDWAKEGSRIFLFPPPTRGIPWDPVGSVACVSRKPRACSAYSSVHHGSTGAQDHGGAVCRVLHPVPCGALQVPSPVLL